MSEGKHTQGPWTLEQKPHQFFWQIYADYKLVASVPAGGNKNTDEQKQRKLADARLVADAPAILYALEELLRWNMIVSSIESDAVFKARAIIAKHKGVNAGITDFVIHDLRHTCAAHLVSAGVPLAEVRDLLGHSTIMMTERYAHLDPGSVRNAVSVLDGLSAERDEAVSRSRYADNPVRLISKEGKRL